MNSKPRATIDDIMFPGEQARTLKAQVGYSDRLLAAIDSHKSAAPASTLLGNAAQKDSTHAPQDCSGALLSMTLSNSETIQYRLVEIYGYWNAYDDNDTSGSGGWGPTKPEAIRDLRERCERESCSDGRARVVSEPQRRDAEFRQALLRTQRVSA